jgi:4'-phosphopantetheinyl transferase
MEYSNPENHHLLYEYRGILSRDEQSRSRAFVMENDRTCYVLSRILKRVVLSRYLELESEAIRFERNAYGKPDIGNRQNQTDIHVSFNLSHTKNLIVLAVSHGNAVGIDVENPKLRKAPLDIANDVFSLQEAQELQNVPDKMKDQRFFQYWTLKESYIKARGQGLSIPLDLFRFSLNGNRIHLHLKSELDDTASNWAFWQLEFFGKYIVAVCSKRETVKQDIIVYGFSSLMQAEVIPHKIICMS